LQIGFDGFTAFTKGDNVVKLKTIGAATFHAFITVALVYFISQSFWYYDSANNDLRVAVQRYLIVLSVQFF